MLRLIQSKEKQLWDDIVRSFPKWDIYYLNAYAHSLERHETGQAFLIDFSFGTERLCYPVIEKDIANAPEFHGLLSESTWLDWETPYGYGGPLSNREQLSIEAQRVFLSELTNICQRRRVVSQFIRFHPLLQNQKVLNTAIEYKKFKNTIFMDLSSEKKIFLELDSKNRNMIRKAQKSGITIFTDQGEHLPEFMELYENAMNRVHAAPYYYFEKSYYNFLRKEMRKEMIFFYAQLNRKIIAASIFLYNSRFMHYHLSGTEESFRTLAPTNLLLYEAACWGSKRGIRFLHLGGGNSNEEDSLFAFKKRFNKNGQIPFYIGKNIFIPDAYQELLNHRHHSDLNFRSNSYFIQYRKPKEEDMSVYIIAEAGVNHNGNFDLALKLVDAAKAAGADCVKFQTSITEECISTEAEKAAYQKETTCVEESQFEMEKKLELSFDQFRQIKDYCDKKEIQFLSSPFDISSVRFLSGLDMPFYKIPSGEITNLPYLIEIAKTGSDVVMSTGMCEIEEIQTAIEVLKRYGVGKITLLHCNTEYPTPYDDVNLRAMETMRKTFHCPVGYSDHTLGIEVAMAAAAMGAPIVEKHFTLDRSMEGPDHKASLEPKELATMVRGIRNIERALGNGIKKPSVSERKNLIAARKSIVARCAIAKGEQFTEKNIAVKRPGSGISPMRWFEVLGVSAKRDYRKDELIEF